MEPSVKHVSGVLECLEHGGWESCLRAISLGKTLFKCRAPHLGFAQIAIGTPHAQPGTLGKIFSDRFEISTVVFTFLPPKHPGKP